jgi:hypothetical protein
MNSFEQPTAPTGVLLHPVVRRRGRRGRMKRGWSASRTKEPKPCAKAERQSKLTESEFLEWLRELAADPKWKNPTPWDEHTFRVGVQIALKRVSPPNSDSATQNR